MSHAAPRSRKHDAGPARSPAPPRAYAVAADGTRRRITAARIAITVDDVEIEVDLARVRGGALRRLSLRAVEGLLVIGPADAGSAHLGVEPFGRASERLQP